jgi:hypothetical protein
MRNYHLKFNTILSQIEACLNSRPLVYTNSPDEDGIEILTPGHFFIGQSLCSLPDPSSCYRSFSLLKSWNLRQNLVHHFWKWWLSEYLMSLNKINQWHRQSRNFLINDIVLIKEGNLVPTHWPLARIIETHPGSDGLVGAVTIRTTNGVYKRPISKIALLLPAD